MTNNVFLCQSLYVDDFPFEDRLEQPNKETVVVILEAEQIICDSSVRYYSNVEEALQELKQ